MDTEAGTGQSKQRAGQAQQQEAVTDIGQAGETWHDNWAPIGWRTDALGEIYSPLKEGGRTVLGSEYVNWLEQELKETRQIIADHNAVAALKADAEALAKLLERYMYALKSLGVDSTREAEAETALANHAALNTEPKSAGEETGGE